MKRESLEIVRERERESNNLRKLGFIFYAKISSKKIIKNRKELKRMNYGIKAKIKKIKLLYDSLSFL